MLSVIHGFDCDVWIAMGSILFLAVFVGMFVVYLGLLALVVLALWERIENRVWRQR